jgi:hypothetical protein
VGWLRFPLELRTNQDWGKDLREPELTEIEDLARELAEEIDRTRQYAVLALGSLKEFLGVQAGTKSDSDIKPVLEQFAEEAASAAIAANRFSKALSQ